MESYKLKFKYGTSKGRDTYGYDIVSLWVDGVKVSSVNGGGYDMFSTVLGNWMTEQFQMQLRRLTSKKYYGLFHYNPKTNKRQNRATTRTTTYLDGACGTNSMTIILKAIGYQMTNISKDLYIVNKKEL